MISVAIADDDIDTLEYLQSVINEQMEGLQVIAEGENGVKLLKNLGDKVPELLITDLTMPQMEGFELATCLRARNPEMAIIFLTCHENFNYAKHAIELQAVDYLVKYTLTDDTLREAVQKAKAFIRKKREIKKEYNSFYREIYTNIRYYKEKTLERLISGKTETLEEVQQQFAVYRIAIPSGPIRTAALYWDDHLRTLSKAALDDEDLLLLATINVAEEMLHAVVFPYQKALIAICDEKFCSESEWNSSLHLLQSKLTEILNKTPSICVGEVCSSFIKIGDAIKKLIHMRDSYFYSSIPAFVTNERNQATMDLKPLYRSYIENFKIALIRLDEGEKKITEMCQELTECNAEPRDVQNLTTELLRILDLQIQYLGQDNKKAWCCMDTMSLCYETLVQRYKQFVSLKVGHSEMHPDIQEVVQYIENHWSEKISLESAAQHIYKNSAHLSRLFHKETGKTFSEYLIEKRIEKATYLLKETSLSVAEICQQIGIDNVHYFYRFYKRETGKTPSDIRNQAF